MTAGPLGVGGSLACAVMLLTFDTAWAQWQATVELRERFFAEPAALGTEGMHHQSLVVADVAGRRRWHTGLGTQILAASAWARVGLRSGAETLLDLDEFHWHLATDHADIRAGVTEVFWGVLESAHLVDVINQRAPDMGVRGSVKLGQPLVSVALTGKWGTMEVYWLPCFRPRPLGGRAARLWTPLAVEAGEPVFRCGAGVRSPGWAARWTRTMGDWDVGLAFFDGTDREPAFDLVSGGVSDSVLVPRYDRIQQLSMDLQGTMGPWLWKLEAATRDPADGRYATLGGGLEYALADYLSVFVEYLYDSRAAGATTSFERDFMAGARLLYPNGRVGALASIDPVSGNVSASLEITRRLTNSLLLAFEGRLLLGDESREPPLARRLDTFVALGVKRFF